MRKRKTMIGLVLVVAVLVLGVGYATISSVDLVMTGTASVKDSTVDVHFDTTWTNPAGVSNNTSMNSEAALDGNISYSADGLTATFAVKDLGRTGDYIRIPFNIVNEDEEFDAKVYLKAAIQNDVEDYFNVAVYQVGSGGTLGSQITTVDTTAITVTSNADNNGSNTNGVFLVVEMGGTPIDVADSEATITVTLLASPILD